MSAAITYTPELGDYVLLPNCSLIPGVGKVVDFVGVRPVVRSLSHPNITVAVKSVKRVVLERCRDPEHPDCLASEELGIDCAQWTRKRIADQSVDRTVS
jgi:hypothetical protein